MDLGSSLPKTKTPRLGDMYVSRHSNLAQVFDIALLNKEEKFKTNILGARGVPFSVGR